MKTRQAWTLIEVLVVIAIIAIAGALLLPLLSGGCKPAKNSSKMIPSGYIQGTITPIYEFTYDGCQYLQMDRGLTHKGNCTNTIHSAKAYLLEGNYVRQ